MNLTPTEPAKSLPATSETQITPTIQATIQATSFDPGSDAPSAVPVVIIGARKFTLGFNLRELWSYHELLYFLTWRDLKVKYKQTLLGVAWVIMQPLLMTVIFSVFLGALARVPTDGVPYALVVYTGLLPWTFFSNAVSGCSFSLTGSANLITKVYFPRVIVPAASVAARVVDFAIAFAILLGLMIYYRAVGYHIGLTWNLLALPFLIILLMTLVFALGMLSSALHVKYRDVGVALPVLLQLWMFVSPVLYPVSLVPQQWRPLYFLNPMAGIIEGFRVALLGGKFPLVALALATAFTFISLIISLMVFRSTEKSFADII